MLVSSTFHAGDEISYSKGRAVTFWLPEVASPMVRSPSAANASSLFRLEWSLAPPPPARGGRLHCARPWPRPGRWLSLSLPAPRGLQAGRHLRYLLHLRDI